MTPVVGPEAGKQSEQFRVLIADDDATTRMMLRAAISQWNYEVVEAADGEEAWQVLQGGDPPKLLIIDWMMPKLDGIALSERIRQQPGLKDCTFIILLTQVSGATNVTRAIEAGANEFLSKPFNMAELRSRLAVGEKIIQYQNQLQEQGRTLEQYAALVRELSLGLTKLSAALPKNSANEALSDLNALIRKMDGFSSHGGKVRHE